MPKNLSKFKKAYETSAKHIKIWVKIWPRIWVLLVRTCRWGLSAKWNTRKHILLEQKTLAIREHVAASKYVPVYGGGVAFVQMFIMKGTKPRRAEQKCANNKSTNFSCKHQVPYDVSQSVSTQYMHSLPVKMVLISELTTTTYWMKMAVWKPQKLSWVDPLPQTQQVYA